MKLAYQKNPKQSNKPKNKTPPTTRKKEKQNKTMKSLFNLFHVKKIDSKGKDAV